MSETNKIEAIYDEYKLVKDKLKVLQHDYNSAVLDKEANDEAIKQQKETLTAVLNQISGEKLAWAQEKAQEQRILDEKKEEVEKVLAREKLLNDKELKLNTQEENITEKLKKNSRILLEIKGEKESNKVILKESQAEVKKAEKLKEEAQQVITDFKAKISEITQQIQEL